MLLTTEVRVDGGYEVPGDGNIGPIKRSLIVEAIDAVFAVDAEPRRKAW
jgi:hypothetical protein